MAKCHGICEKIDKANNNIDIIIAISNTRNLTYRCKRKNGYDGYLPKYDYRLSERYTSRCTTCDYLYRSYAGLECPCCGQRVSKHKKNKSHMSFIEPEPIPMVIRSHVGYTSGKDLFNKSFHIPKTNI